MGWSAKPEAFPFWNISSEECLGNADEIYNLLYGEWTLTAICGMLGNMHSESGVNPWCWQNNTVNVHNGYGLVQFTPGQCYINGQGQTKYGYISNTALGITGYGEAYAGYSPNMSVTEVSGGNVSDGNAQILAVNDNAGGKYSSYNRHCDYADITSVNTFADYKQCEDLWVATVGWLYYYEAPQDKSYQVAQTRFTKALAFWEHFSDDPPVPPRPPKPTNKMPIWMYLRRV